jgi:prepilin-type N-terminal cleavage/methylation domain
MHRNMNRTKRSSEAGFTLIEMMIVVGVTSVMMGMAVVVMPNMVKQAKADASAEGIVNTLRLARDRAISERRNMDLVFVHPNRLKVVREEIIYNSVTGTWSSSPTGSTNPTLIDTTLENNQKFTYLNTGDTGDAFGLTNKPLAFGALVASVPTIMFTSEGTLVDVNGDATNGTIFLAAGLDPLTARAVTIFGATGLVKVWKWDGMRWVE